MRLQFFEDGDFSHGGGGYSFILILEFDLFEGDEGIEDGIFGFEDDSIGSFSESLHSFISVLELLDHHC